MTLNSRSLRYAGLVSLYLVGGYSGMALAQSPQLANPAPSTTLQTYDPVYFTDYAPQTALDMVRRIPGFSINFADEKRGLGQGGANILINGKRLTGKTDAESQLARLNAASVTKIDILDGASLSIPGLSGQVANIHIKVNGVGGNWRWSPEFQSGIEPDWFNGEVSLAGTRGALDYVLRVKNRSVRSWSSGPETLRTDDGQIFETREEFAKEFYDRPGVGLDLSFKPKPGHIVNLNADYEDLKFVGAFESDQTAVLDRGNTQLERLDILGNQWSTDIGLDYEFPLGAGQLKLIGFHAFEHQNPVRQFDTRNSDGLIRRTKFPQTSEKSELILRSEYSLSPSQSGTWQMALEGAFNNLDVENQFLSAGPDGLLTGAPINKFDVSEDRYEASLTHNRNVSPNLDVQLSLGGEYSILAQQSLDATEPRERQFFRPKGFAAATYKYSPSLDIRGRLEREVGQLNFFDFVSSTNLADDLDVTANPDLVPEQSWLGSVEFDKGFGHGNRFKAKVYGASITDIVDRIPIGQDGEGVGNLDQAYRYGVDFSSTLKGDQWGWKGTQLDLRLEFRNSTLDDPLLGFSRRINADKKSFYSVAFRHDIEQTDWAYGMSLERFFRAKEFRTFSFTDKNFTAPWLLVFVEHKDVAGMKVRLEANNLLDRGDILERTFFTDRRDLGQIDRIERRNRTIKPYVRLELTGQF